MKPNELLIVVLDPHGGLTQPQTNGLLSRWLTRQSELGSAVEFGPGTHGIDVARNQIINDFLDRTDFSHLLMLDCDTVPLPPKMGDSLDKLLENPPAIGWCGYVGTQGMGGNHMDTFGCGCSIYTHEPLLKIMKPWFQMGLSVDGCTIENCECKYFADKCREADITPQRIGVVGHMQHCVLLPAANTKTGWGILWPWQVV
jgi:hypothetical protein